MKEIERVDSAPKLAERTEEGSGVCLDPQGGDGLESRPGAKLGTLGMDS